MAALHSLAATQPFRAAYSVFAVVSILTRVPFWVVKYVLARFRQHPAYSYKQALMVRIIRAISGHISNMQMRIPLPITPGREKSQWVTVPPSDNSAYAGVLDTSAVRATTVGGTWYPRTPGNTELAVESSGDIVLHLHGGGYVLGDGRKGDWSFLALNLLRHGNVSYIFIPQYRLSSKPVNTPFPGALQDAVTSYLYLTKTLGVAPERIILSGDSAGGNLSLALLKYIVECGGDIDGLRAPACAWLWSPWVSPRLSQDKNRTLRNPNYHTDYLHSSFGSWGSGAYHRNIAPGTPADLYINFLSPNPPLKTTVPIYMWTGKLEVLYFDIVKLAEELKEEGNTVHLDVDPTAPHDVIYLGNKIFFHEAAKKGVKNAAEWFSVVRKA